MPPLQAESHLAQEQMTESLGSQRGMQQSQMTANLPWFYLLMSTARKE